jgi:ParB-like chromosome segregation protein Spo0J
MKLEKQPINNIQWIHVDLLKANDYNPNVVFNQELKLLKFSLLKQGWIQPIIVTQDYEIIDGYHRSSLAKTDEQIKNMTDGLVPVVIMNLDEHQRKTLTIRINRAKGSHIALKMSEIIKSLVEQHHMSIKDIAEEIGATKKEIDTLLMTDVFKALDIENKEFSKAWIPKR